MHTFLAAPSLLRIPFLFPHSPLVAAARRCPGCQARLNERLKPTGRFILHPGHADLQAMWTDGRPWLGGWFVWNFGSKLPQRSVHVGIVVQVDRPLLATHLASQILLPRNVHVHRPSAGHHASWSLVTVPNRGRARAAKEKRGCTVPRQPSPSSRRSSCGYLS